MIKQGVQLAIVEPRQLREGSDISPGFGALSLFNRQAHPNAAKVYINWLLSKDGQTEFSRAQRRICLMTLTQSGSFLIFIIKILFRGASHPAVEIYLKEKDTTHCMEILIQGSKRSGPGLTRVNTDRQQKKGRYCRSLTRPGAGSRKTTRPQKTGDTLALPE